MKSKKIKKLVLNKETISSLSEYKMNKFKGGATIFENWLCTYGCGNTPDTCDSPQTYYCFSQEDGSKCGTCMDDTGHITCCNHTYGEPPQTPTVTCFYY